MDGAVILYDSDCGFCRWVTDRILAWDRAGRLRPVALQSAEAAERLPGLTPDERLSSWHLVASDGAVYSAGRAVAPLLRLLPGGRAPAAVAAACPGLVDRSYRWTAAHREDFGRLVGAKACAVDPGSKDPAPRGS